VAQWNESALTYHATGQACPRFTAQHAMSPGDTLPMGGTAWHVLAAPGHDNDAVLLFAPEHRVLIAGDALWANGLSIVFPEIGAQGDWGAGFAAVADTLALIESLQPRLVIAGHGPLITDPPAALAQARSRLAHFQRKPAAHALYAAKVLLKFHLLAVQHSTVPAVLRWMAHTPDLQALHRLSQSGNGNGNGNAREPEQANAREASFDDWAQSLIQALAQSGAARLDAGHIHNA
jgi:glyoxylase-like metal-dependent hydrolase (beta-lactamase superfamily II)